MTAISVPIIFAMMSLTSLCLFSVNVPCNISISIPNNAELKKAKIIDFAFNMPCVLSAKYHNTVKIKYAIAYIIKKRLCLWKLAL